MKRFFAIGAILVLIVGFGGIAFASSDETETNAAGPGCGQSPVNGTLKVVCSNFPEDVVAVNVMIFPKQLFMQAEKTNPESEKNTQMQIAPMEGIARCKTDGAPVTVMAQGNRKTPADLSGGRHRVVVLIKSGLLKSELALSNVVVKGDTTLTLNYEKLRFPAENMKNLLELLKKFAENMPEEEPADLPMN